MRVIEGKDVDLISPFPHTQAHRVFGWMQCASNVVDTPKDKPAFDEMLDRYLNLMETFGVIDKNNILKMDHEAPLVGILCFEPHTNTSRFMHFTSTRRAWGTRLMDAAVQVALQDMFETFALRRVGSLVLVTNNPAKGFLRRAGFRPEATFKELVEIEGKAKDVAQFVAFKDSWSPKTVEVRAR